jgi:polysaccharide export outer membrane protein
MTSFAKWISAAVGCVLLVAGPCAAAQAPARPAAPNAPAPAASPTQTGVGVADNNYILGPGDAIEVSVLGRADFTTRARIDADGKIQLPYLGTLKVSEQTATQLADVVGKALEKGGYFAHPIMKVDVVSYASRYVIVLGAVGAPGLVPVDRAYRLSEILARVGGVKENGADFVVLTPENGPNRNLLIKDLATGDSSQDPYVQPGDKIYSPLGEIFYISGEVKSPSTLGLTPGLTVGMAIAKAGGISDLGTTKGIKITRKGKTVDNVTLEEKVQPNDVIMIKQRLF